MRKSPTDDGYNPSAPTPTSAPGRVHGGGGGGNDSNARGRQSSTPHGVKVMYCAIKNSDTHFIASERSLQSRQRATVDASSSGLRVPPTWGKKQMWKLLVDRRQGASSVDSPPHRV